MHGQLRLGGLTLEQATEELLEGGLASVDVVGEQAGAPDLEPEVARFRGSFE